MNKLATITARVVLGAIALALVVSLLLIMVWWRLVTFPYRRLNPPRKGKRLQIEAGVALLTALAAFVTALRKPAPAAAAAPAPRAKRTKREIVRVQGEVYPTPDAAREAADELAAQLDDAPLYDGRREQLAKHIERLREAADAVEAAA